MSSIKKLFRQNLTWFREQKDLSQSELSQRCDYDRTYVGKIERGEKEPSLEAIIRLSRELDVSMTDFFRSDRPETNETLAHSLQQGEDIYKVIFDDTYPMPSLFDTEGRFVEVNEAFLELCTRTKEDLIGRPLWECRFWGPSEWREKWLKKQVEEAAAGEPMQENMKIFLPEIDEETMILFSLTPIRQQSEIRHLLGSIKLLERKESEGTLLRQLT